MELARAVGLCHWCETGVRPPLIYDKPHPGFGQRRAKFTQIGNKMNTTSYDSRMLMTHIEQPTVELPPEQTYRILTLENPENIEKLKQACKSAGHQVVPCFTIAEAMKFLESKDHVDVIVAAAHLENESVFSFLQKVKSSDCILHKAHFFMLCADPGMLALVTSPSVEIAANLMGADKYLLMPEFDAEKLMAEIEELFPAKPYKELVI